MSATPYLVYLQGTAAAGAGGVGNGTQINTMDGYGLMGLEVVGTFSGTVTWEGSLDGTAWFGVGLKTMADGAAVLTATTVGQFKLPTDVLLSKFRARISAWTSGTITVRALILSRNV